MLLRLRAHPSLRDSLLADAPQPLGVLVLLFLLGAAVRAADPIPNPIPIP